MSHADTAHEFTEIERRLRAHAFRELFIEVLGWDHFSRAVRIAHGGVEYPLAPIAHKRGLAVYHCALDRVELRDRGVLRGIQRGLRPYAFENLLIFTDRAATTQVWQWAAQPEPGRLIVTREHPFPSHQPPPKFVRRLIRLRVSLDREERISLLDVARDAARAFNEAADLPIFFRNPRYLYESERLASELITGGTAALHRFIESHDGLAQWIARRYEFTGVDLEDLEQMARLGLIRAAERFEPQRGHAFSTYAFQWMRQCCTRHLQSYVFHGGLRPDLFWLSLRVIRRFRRSPRSVHSDARFRLLRRMEEQAEIGRWAARLLGLWETEHLYQHPITTRAAMSLSANEEAVPEQAARRDEARLLHEAVASLDRRSAHVVRRRYGLDDGREHTLEEVAQELGLTRERVRQLQVAALARLHRRVCVMLGRRPAAVRGSNSRPPSRKRPGNVAGRNRFFRRFKFRAGLFGRLPKIRSRRK